MLVSDQLSDLLIDLLNFSISVGLNFSLINLNFLLGEIFVVNGETLDLRENWKGLDDDVGGVFFKVHAHGVAELQILGGLLVRSSSQLGSSESSGDDLFDGGSIAVIMDKLVPLNDGFAGVESLLEGGPDLLLALLNDGIVGDWSRVGDSQENGHDDQRSLHNS